METEEEEFCEKKMRPIPETPPPSTPPAATPPHAPVEPVPAKPSTTIHDILSSIGIDLKGNAAFSQSQPPPSVASSQPGDQGDTSEYAMRGRQYRSDMMAAYKNGSTPPQPFEEEPPVNMPADPPVQTVADAARIGGAPNQQQQQQQPPPQSHTGVEHTDTTSYVRPSAEQRNRRGPFADRGVPASMVSKQSSGVPAHNTMGAGSCVLDAKQPSTVHGHRYPAVDTRNQSSRTNSTAVGDDPHRRISNRDMQGNNQSYSNRPLVESQRVSACSRDVIDVGESHQALDDLFNKSSTTTTAGNNIHHHQAQPQQYRTPPTNQHPQQQHLQQPSPHQGPVSTLNPGNPLNSASTNVTSPTQNMGSIEEIASKCGFNPAMLNFLKMAQSNGMFTSPSTAPPPTSTTAPVTGGVDATSNINNTTNNNYANDHQTRNRQPFTNAQLDSARQSSMHGINQPMPSNSPLANPLGQLQPQHPNPLNNEPMSNSAPHAFAQLPPGAIINPNAEGYNPASSEVHLERYMNASIGGGSGGARGGVGGAMNFNYPQRSSTGQNAPQLTNLHGPPTSIQQEGEDISDIFSQFIRKSPLRTNHIEAFNPSPPSTHPFTAPSLQQPQHSTKRDTPKQSTPELVAKKTVRVLSDQNYAKSPSIHEQVSLIYCYIYIYIVIYCVNAFSV